MKRGLLTPRRSSRAWLVGVIILFAACGDGDAGAEGAIESPPTPVRTVPVTVSEQANPVRTSGTLASGTEMDLAFKIPGYVAEVLVDEGDRVTADQVLARLRTDEVDAQVRVAKAQAELASKNLARFESLFADSVVTEATLDEARDGYERAQAAMELAEFDQRFATIRAPSAGRVLRRMVEVAEFSGAGVPAFRVGATSSGWVVRLSVTDRQVVRIALGDAAEVRLSALAGETFSGMVTEIAEAADPRSGTFELEITVNGNGRLRSGMVAQVSITPSVSTEVSLLPAQSLIDTEGLDAAVFVVQGDRVRRHPVRVVSIGSELVGVYAPGLENARIVTDGAAYLRDGDRVEDRTADLPPTGN